MAAPRNPYEVYKNTEVLTSSPAQLVVLLYEGAIKHLAKGEALLGDPGRFGDAAMHLLRSMSIVGELLGVLDPKASPELAAQLSGIYQYVLELIGRSLQERDPVPLTEASRLMGSLASAWREIVARSAA